MNLSELCADVYVKTNRPDLAAETQLAIRNAARKFHLLEFFQRDRAEKLISFTALGTAFSIPIAANFENWRKFKYIRPWDADASAPKGGENRMIKEVDPAKIFDEFGSSKVDVGYVAGDQLNFKTSEAESAFVVCWYKYPNLNVNNFSSWIADMYPEILIEHATGDMLNILGQVEEANKILDPQKGTIFNPMFGMLHALKVNELEMFAR